LSAAVLPGERFVFDAVERVKIPLLRVAATRFLERNESGSEFELFRTQHKSWLTDFCRYEVLKRLHQNTSWTTWPHPYRLRDPAALQSLDLQFGAELSIEAALQFLFDAQWQRIRRNANSRGIRIMGDIPIFVA